jgi:hypothetical protein
MGLDKFSVTLYDLLGYLLPGYVLLTLCSFIEATFWTSGVFALSRLNHASILSLILAYFLGHVSHGLAAWLKLTKPGWFKDGAYTLTPAIRKRVTEALKKVYGLEVKEEDLSRLEVYLLADNYILANGGSVERDILTAREGFFKASMTALALVTIALPLSLFTAPRFQISPGSYIFPSTITVVVFTACAVLLTALFRRRFIFFNCAKNNNALLTFLALTVRTEPVISI